MSEVVAPDGIPVQPIPLPGSELMSLAFGRIPAGSYGVHVHCSLEQVTVGLVGTVAVTMRAPSGEVTVAELGPDAVVVTPPLHTLSFANSGSEDARVLFICSPTYPADDADVVLPGQHRALTADELRRALGRQRQARADAITTFDARLAELEALLSIQDL